MRHSTIIVVTLCATVLTGCEKEQTAAPKPTVPTLEQWLEGKEVVSVTFEGRPLEPQMNLGKLCTWLEERGHRLNDAHIVEYFCTPGIGGGKDRGFVRVDMKTTS